MSKEHIPESLSGEYGQPNDAMDAYDKAQTLILEGKTEDVEFALVKAYPELNAQGLIPTILRRAARDLQTL
jgi:hypothetical protein